MPPEMGVRGEWRENGEFHPKVKDSNRKVFVNLKDGTRRSIVGTKDGSRFYNSKVFTPKRSPNLI